MLKEYDNMKEGIKNLKSSTLHQGFYFVYKTMLSYFLKCRETHVVKTQGLQKQI